MDHDQAHGLLEFSVMKLSLTVFRFDGCAKDVAYFAPHPHRPRTANRRTAAARPGSA
jgi:hypothetical protein